MTALVTRSHFLGALLLVVLCSHLGVAVETHSANENAQHLGGLGLSTLDIRSKPGQPARLNLSQGSRFEYSLGLTPEGHFIVESQGKILAAIDQKNNVLVNTESLTAGFISADGLVLGGVKQWHLAMLEMFAPGQALTGWSANAQVLDCGGVAILHAPSRSSDVKEVSKEWVFKSSNHTQMRVVAVAHFVDDWQGEAGFLKVDDKFVWTETHDQNTLQSNLNICGSDRFPEGRFSVAIDVTVPHNRKELKISFGSSLDNDEAYFGISSLSIYLR